MSNHSNGKSPGQPYAAIPEHVLYERIAGEFVLLDLNSGEYYGIDSVGTRIIDLVQHYCNLEEVVDVMLDEYEVDEERLRVDLEGFVGQLVSKGFLETHDEASQ